MLKTNKVRFEVGIVSRYAVVQTVHAALLWNHRPFVKMTYTSNGIAKTAVTKSEIANERINRLVVALRRFGLKLVAAQTRELPMMAATMIPIREVSMNTLNAGEKNKYR